MWIVHYQRWTQISCFHIFRPPFSNLHTFLTRIFMLPYCLGSFSKHSPLRTTRGIKNPRCGIYQIYISSIKPWKEILSPTDKAQLPKILPDSAQWYITQTPLAPPVPQILHRPSLNTSST